MRDQWLGKDLDGIWEKALVSELDKVCNQTFDDIKNANTFEGLGAVNLLNYILSSVNCTPGFTDRTLAKITSEKIPFENWMLDENKLVMLTGQDGTWRGPIVDALDTNPLLPTPIAALQELREEIARNHVLFVTGEGDAFVPAMEYQTEIDKYSVPGHTDRTILEGGHHVIFLENGYQTFVKWAQDK